LKTGTLKPLLTYKLEPYREYLRERWQKGIQNGKVLLREIKERGYSGGYTALKDFLYPWREQKALPSKATVRFETLPGEQAQVDFSRFKYQANDGSSRYLWAFVRLLLGAALIMVLGLTFPHIIGQPLLESSLCF